MTKEKVLDRDIWQIPQSTLDFALRQVEENIGRYVDIKKAASSRNIAEGVITARASKSKGAELQ